MTKTPPITRTIFALAALASVLIALSSLCAIVCVDTWSMLNRNGRLYLIYTILRTAGCAFLPIFVFGRYILPLYRILIPFWTLLTFILVFVHHNFRFQLDGSWVGILASSNSRETMEFFAEYGFPLVLAFFVVIIALVLLDFAIRPLAHLDFGRARKPTLVVAVAILTLQSFLGYPISRNGALYLVINTFHTFTRYNELARLRVRPELPVALARRANIPPDFLGLIVIGESATRGHLALYGYPRDTTPNLCAIANELIVFTDVRTSSISTCDALMHLLTCATRERPTDYRHTLPQVLSAVGYDVSLISNQRRWGVNDGTTHYAFAGCKRTEFICENKSPDEPSYDLEMLQSLDAALASQTAPSVRILHCLGSHNPIYANYPPSERFFPVRDISLGINTEMSRDPVLKRNHYDNTIRYTDRLLGELITRLKQRSGPNFLVYLSDHGETPDISKWRVATESSSWEIPLVIWLSPDFRARYPALAEELANIRTRPQSLDGLLPMLMQLCGIESRIQPCQPEIRGTLSVE